MVPNKDFKFRDDLIDPENKDTIPIEILLEKYKGVVYRYNTVQINEQENNTAKLKFTYEILEQPKFLTEDLKYDSVFVQVIGTILNGLILEVADSEFNNNEGTTIREENSEEFSD